jgi:hypothetical protein
MDFLNATLQSTVVIILHPKHMESAVFCEVIIQWWLTFLKNRQYYGITLYSRHDSAPKSLPR